MKSLIAMLSLLFAVSANAAAQTTVEQYAFSAVYSAPCQPESIAVSGFLQTTITTSAFDGNHTLVQFRTVDVNAIGVGLTSGLSYKVSVNESSKFIFDRDSISGTTLKQKMSLKGSGPSNDLSITYYVRALMGDDGQWITVFEKVATATCK